MSFSSGLAATVAACLALVEDATADVEVGTSEVVGSKLKAGVKLELSVVEGAGAVLDSVVGATVVAGVELASVVEAGAVVDSTKPLEDSTVVAEAGVAGAEVAGAEVAGSDIAGADVVGST